MKDDCSRVTVGSDLDPASTHPCHPHLPLPPSIDVMMHANSSLSLSLRFVPKFQMLGIHESATKASYLTLVITMLCNRHAGSTDSYRVLPETLRFRFDQAGRNVVKQSFGSSVSHQHGLMLVFCAECWGHLDKKSRVREWTERQGFLALLLGTRTLLGTKGIATRNKGHRY